MKYHGHIIKKIYADLGEENENKNRVYQIFNKEGKFVNEALILNSAKDYINNKYEKTYL